MTNPSGFRYQDGIMQATPEGLLLSQTAVLLPVMAPRLQADIDPQGKLTLAIWGVGTLATVVFSALEAPFLYAPNRLTAANGGVFVAQSQPVMVVCGAAARRVLPAKRAAWWHKPTSGEETARQTRTPARRSVVLAWGVMILEQRGPDLLIAGGADLAEAEKACTMSVDAIRAEADAYVTRCDRLPEADPLLRSMVQQGTHAALSSIRHDRDGQFGGLAAGQAYSAPARTYYRDGYWTLQPLLRLAPDAVRGQVRLLAAGIRPDGEAPSAVILSGPAQSGAWDAFRRTAPRYKDEHLRPGEWWSDHFDSPLFFILTLGDYVRTTGDHAEARTHWEKVKAVVARYVAASGLDGLPRKPDHDRDWADNVYREGLVSYNIGLWIGALDAVVAMGETVDPTMAAQAKALADTARAHVETALWSEQAGNYVDFKRTDGFSEDHLMIDSLTLLRYGAVDETRAVQILEKARKHLESRHNGDQPYGDWGVLCTFPPYARGRDVRAKSAFAFRYHNGSDWPYWDGVYAQERLKRNLGNARYALTRWWQACLDNGWTGAIEYYSPPFGRGSLLQGWSGLPADVAVMYRKAVGLEGND
jgi:glycogen debranching enzyme